MIANLKKLRNKIRAYIKNRQVVKHYFRNVGTYVLPDEQANDLLFKKVTEGKPCFITRFGSSELASVLFYRSTRQPDTSNLWNKHHEHILCDVSGFFPFTQESMDRFSNYYIDIVNNIDVLGVWNVGEDHVADLFNKKIELINLPAIEPYYFDNPWSRALAGKKVLLIHPFAHSIRSQYERRELLFTNKNILPAFDLKIIQAVQTVADNTQGYTDWFVALEDMCRQIREQEFDVAIIGAGAYGMPIGNFIKMEMGKVAIHMGGATQLLFGIKGKRWDDFPKVKAFFNEYWVNPSLKERPVGLEKVEGGSYW